MKAAHSDAELLPLITSANVSCGWHAGDAATALATMQGAVKEGVRVGAHPGFADREHFGRRELAQSELQIYHDCIYQIAALDGPQGASSRHQRRSTSSRTAPLYNLACRDDAYARPLVAVAEFFPAAARWDCRVRACRKRCRQGAVARFRRRGVCRSPLSGGRFAGTARSTGGLCSNDAAEAVAQTARLVRECGIATVCVHGDNPKAVAFVRAACGRRCWRAAPMLRPFA